MWQGRTRVQMTGKKWERLGTETRQGERLKAETKKEGLETRQEELRITRKIETK